MNKIHLCMNGTKVALLIEGRDIRNKLTAVESDEDCIKIYETGKINTLTTPIRSYISEDVVTMPLDEFMGVVLEVIQKIKEAK